MLPPLFPTTVSPSPVRLHGRMPDDWRRPLSDSDWCAANAVGRVIDSFIEGPVFDGAGRLYLTDIPNGRVMRIEEDGSWRCIAQYDGEPNGLKFLQEGVLLVTDYRRGLLRIDVESGTVAPFLTRVNSESFKGVNDLTFDSAGNLYFTDQGQTGLHDPTGRVYRRRVDGTLDLLLATVPSPNGIAVSPDGHVLYVAATRDNAVWRGTLNRNGLLSKVGRFFSLNGPGGPDGVAVTPEGDLIVAAVGSGCVWRVDAAGRPVQVWDCSDFGMMPTNIALGGPPPGRVYITESSSGSVLVGDLEPSRGMGH
jgi:gluconolactonase